MKMEVIEEGKKSKKKSNVPEVKSSSCGKCEEGGTLLGCCIIHFWCWEGGHGACC